MDKTTRVWIETTISTLNEIQNDFCENKGLILTEGDLECELYRKLTEKLNFKDRVKCKTSDWKTSSIHSQITWFKPDRESGFLVDLTILNPRNLDIQTFEMSRDYPNKGFFYDGEAVAIEIKFIRENNEAQIALKAQKDFLKIIEELRAAKEENIKNAKYFRANMANVGFVVIIGCKSEQIYSTALASLKEVIIDEELLPENVFVAIFSHNQFELFHS